MEELAPLEFCSAGKWATHCEVKRHEIICLSLIRIAATIWMQTREARRRCCVKKELSEEGKADLYVTMKWLDRLCSGEKFPCCLFRRRVRMLRMKTFAALVEIGTSSALEF